MKNFIQTASGLHVPHGLSPAIIGLPRKTLTNPSAESAAISEAVQAVANTDGIMPVLWGRNIIGWTDTDAARRHVTFYRRPAGMNLVGYATYDDIINACTAGRRLPCIWSKGHTTAPVASNWMDLWPVGGAPAAGSYTGAALTARQFSDATAGALYSGGNVETTYNKFVLYCWAFASAGTPTLMLYDRVLSYEACTIAASLQTMTNTLAAQRYIGAGQSGLKVAVTCQTVMGATASNISAMAYTNQAGTAAQAMPTTRTVATIVSAAAPTTSLGARFVAAADAAGTTVWSEFLPLNTGDSGVRKVESFTCSVANTGTLAFVLARPLFVIPTGTAGVASMVDGVFQIANLERVYDGCCLSFFAYFPAATAATFNGEVSVGWN